MRLKHLSAAILIAISGAAVAVPTTTVRDLGTLDASGATFHHGWWRLFEQGSPLGDFVDSYKFSLVTDSDALGAVLTFQYGALDILLSGVTLIKEGFGAIADNDPALNSYSFSGLGAGNYTLNVSGNVSDNGSADGGVAGYRGEIYASPAPEPANVAMMLAGLALIGSFVAARRKS